MTWVPTSYMLWNMFRTWVGSLLSLIITAGVVYPQANQGQLSGIVTDASGALITGAKVRVVNANNGRSYETLTNSAGVYRAPALEAGS